ncbi:putative ER lumen protein retaining receptor [Helianthus annuus]|nr:putative ER lumen protein retaining receptor [Helianthus annuus]KAJ0662174.1 putative ER lumen protein retaining receptor [Helianthus annuus]KAJ0856381.1 putative ER lumen protein retaining receptor [Helianthus annuus]KAJ0954581.1 putative ER lumen protein retaining receptor [Helianthus annuus]
MKQPVQALQAWLRRQPPKIKVFLASVSALAALIVIRLVVYDHDNLFIAAEAVHALGISVLIFKLATEKTCAGSTSSYVPFFLHYHHYYSSCCYLQSFSHCVVKNFLSCISYLINQWFPINSYKQ